MNYYICFFIIIFLLAIYLKKHNNLNETFDNFRHNSLDNQKYLTINGHTCTITKLKDNPIMLEIYPFLSKNECNHIIKVASKDFNRSPVVNKKGYDESRTSYTSYLDKNTDDPIIKTIQNRIYTFCNIKPCSLEDLQVVRYKPGQKFGYHYDWFDPEIKEGRKEITRGGQRLYTLFIYLNDLSEREYSSNERDNHNGHTCFKKLDLCVKPKAGLAVFWKNLVDGKLNYDSLHAGIAPKHSIKYGLNVWIREGCFVK